MIRTLFAITGSMIALASAPVSADYDRLIGVFIGGLELDEQTGDRIDENGQPIAIDFPTLPTGGIEGEYRYGGERIAWGLNPGGSIAFKSDDTNFSGGFTEETGGVLAVEIDNSLFLIELHLGAYVRGRLHPRVTAYAAGGPMIMYGSHDVEDESVEPATAGEVDLDETDANDINIGYYARAGFDFEIGENQYMGFGVRLMRTELDFDKTVGEIDIEGPQYILTFSTQF